MRRLSSTLGKALSVKRASPHRRLDIVVHMINAHSFHKEAADLLAEEWAQTDQGARRLAMAYLASRDEDIAYNIDVFGQPYGGWTMGQLFCLYCLMAMYASGSLAVAEFRLSRVPFRDRERIKNAEILEELRPLIHPIVDEKQRGAEGDGLIKWNYDLKAMIEPGAQRKEVSISARRSAILEIGYTDASNICMQLLDCGVVARWPYGHRTLTILAEYPDDGVIDRWRLHEYPIDGVTQGWRRNAFSEDAPSVIAADLAKFAHIIVLNRMTRILGQAFKATRPSAEERSLNAKYNFGWKIPR